MDILAKRNQSLTRLQKAFGLAPELRELKRKLGLQKTEIQLAMESLRDQISFVQTSHYDFLKQYRSQYLNQAAEIQKNLKKILPDSPFLNSKIFEQNLVLSAYASVNPGMFPTFEPSISEGEGLADIDLNDSDNIEHFNQMFDKIEESQQFYKTGNYSTKTQLLSLSDIITLLSVLLTLYQLFLSKTDERISSMEVKIEDLEQSNNKFEASAQEFNSRLDSLLDIQNTMSIRTCIHSNKVLKSPKRGALALGWVKEGQKVNVVEVRSNFKSKKWIFVTYEDYEHKVPKAGWVLKKYFRRQ